MGTTLRKIWSQRFSYNLLGNFINIILELPYYMVFPAGVERKKSGYYNSNGEEDRNEHNLKLNIKYEL
jgi:hypothetical protein